jgi:zinc transport system substrate-binding protein
MRLQQFLVSFLFFLVLSVASAAAAAPLPIVVSIPPQRWLAEQVGGELVRVHVLLDKARDPHSFEPTPEQIMTLFRSRLYFTVSLEFERELIRKVNESETAVRTVDVTAGIKKIPMTGHDAHDHGGHDDPHVWLDPQNLKAMAETMAAAMMQADPVNTSVYTQNLQSVSKTLTALHQDVKATLAPFSGRTFFVYHPAFGYFAKAYNLCQTAVETEGKSPSSKQLYALTAEAKKKKVKAVFIQPQLDRRNAEIIAKAIGASVETLDDLAEDVPENLRRMAEHIRSALDGE